MPRAIEVKCPWWSDSKSMYELAAWNYQKNKIQQMVEYKLRRQILNNWELDLGIFDFSKAMPKGSSFTFSFFVKLEQE